MCSPSRLIGRPRSAERTFARESYYAYRMDKIRESKTKRRFRLRDFERSIASLFLKQVERFAQRPTFLGGDSESDSSLAAGTVETDVSLESISSQELGEILRLP